MYRVKLLDIEIGAGGIDPSETIAMGRGFEVAFPINWVDAVRGRCARRVCYLRLLPIQWREWGYRQVSSHRRGQVIARDLSPREVVPRASERARAYASREFKQAGAWVRKSYMSPQEYIYAGGAHGE